MEPLNGTEEWKKAWLADDMDCMSGRMQIEWIDALIKNERQKTASDLRSIINRCQTEKGLGISLVRYANKLSALDEQ